MVQMALEAKASREDLGRQSSIQLNCNNSDDVEPEGPGERSGRQSPIQLICDTQNEHMSPSVSDDSVHAFSSEHLPALSIGKEKEVQMTVSQSPIQLNSNNSDDVVEWYQHLPALSIGKEKEMQMNVDVSDEDCISETASIDNETVLQVNVDANNEDCVSETESNILISEKDCSTKSKNRKLPCFYCQKFFFHINRHLQRKHAEEPDVASAVAKTTGKNLALQRIQYNGIYKHNIGVLQSKDGMHSHCGTCATETSECS